MLTLTLVKLIVSFALVGIGLVKVSVEIYHFFEDKKEEKQLHKDFINKTGVYSYLKK